MRKTRRVWGPDYVDPTTCLVSQARPIFRSQTHFAESEPDPPSAKWVWLVIEFLTLPEVDFEPILELL